MAELTGVLKLSGWPKDMRVIVRAERPHPGAQLKFTDSNGSRLVANTKGGQLADLECGTGAAPAARTESVTRRTPA